MLTIADIQTRIKNGESVREIVKDTLARAEAAKDYNAVISLVKDHALSRADEIDADLKAGKKLGRLAGVPFIAKDIFLTKAGKTTAASNILKNFAAPYQSTVIERLEAEGAILIGKANLDAFAHGGSTENSDFGVVKNPYDTTRVAGGSSGGSAVVVALDVVPFSLGTDTGGSTRQPASFCGIVGVKPTYGTISRFGVVAMASSTDTIGTFANTVDDAALVFDVIAGKDQFDSTTLPDRSISYMPVENPIKKLKIAVVKEYMGDAVQQEVRDAIRTQVEKLRSLGHEVGEVSLPTLPLSLAVYYIVCPAEVSSNLSRYDGIKFGASATQVKDLADLYGQTREIFNAENKRRILIGTYVLSSGYIDAYYHKAQTVRTKLINEFANAFAAYDVLVGPVAPTTAFKIGENVNDPLQMYLTDILSVAANLTGIPGISLPAGKDSKGLPIGMQLLGAQRSDALLFALSKQLEEANRG
jgi:aspartyl-tRNA(Asn)/glutamyl-tRNA(Gln) amidotransferase subunit A